MDVKYLNRLNFRLFAVILVVLTLALVANSYFALRAFESTLVPELERKAQTVGRGVNALLVKTVDYGIPFKQLVGVDKVLTQVANVNDEFDYLAVTDESGQQIYFGRDTDGILTQKETKYITSFSNDSQAWKDWSPGAGPPLVSSHYVVSVPIEDKGQRLGFLHIGVPQQFVEHIMREILLDILAVLVVALFLTFELLYFIGGGRLSTQMAAMTRTFEAIRNGNFAARVNAASQDEFGRLAQLVDRTIDAVNARYLAVVHKIDALAASGSAQGIAAAQLGRDQLKTLQGRFVFGTPAPAAEPRDGYLGQIRTPLFLFVFAEELSRSFLPLFVNQLSAPVPWLNQQIVIGLPIMLFMVVVALSQPVIGAWSERVGRRRALLTGVIIGSAGFFLTAFAHNLVDLLLWRSLTAVGYGMVFAAAQGYVLDNTDERNRSQGLALFIGAIMVAAICGPSIGGILADRIGFRMTFVVSTVLAVVSWYVSYRRIARPVIDIESIPPLRWADVRTLLSNRSFLALLLSASVPAKIILSAFSFYLIPLYITKIGSNPSTTGRLLMLYAIVMVFLMPIAARISDRIGKRPIFVVVGLALSGFAGLVMLFSGSLLTILALVILLGLGQAISIAPQSALVGELCRRQNIPIGESTVYGVFRLVERLGNATGPILAGILLARYGYEGAFATIGVLVLVGAAFFYIVMRGTKYNDKMPEFAGRAAAIPAEVAG